MARHDFSSPVVVDGIVSDEKVAELLALQAEYPELDYKSMIDLSSTAGEVELAKDVGAMRVRGGYILGGVDNNGVLTGQLDGTDTRLFDESRLVPKLQKYMAGPLQIRTNVVPRDGHPVPVIWVLPSPEGCTFMISDGQYEKNGKPIGKRMRGLRSSRRSADASGRNSRRLIARDAWARARLAPSTSISTRANSTSPPWT